MRIKAPALACAVVALSCMQPPEVVDEQAACRLAEGVSEDALLAHLEALAAIADEHGGNRAAGSPGYEASVAHVEARLREAGLTVEREAFTYPEYEFHAPPELEQIEPDPAVYTLDVDFGRFRFSGAGEVTAPLRAVDPSGDPAVESTSGCEAEDFAGFVAGEVALVERGGCSFRVKVDNAEAAGAAAVIIFNDGATEARVGPFEGSLGSTGAVGVPVVSASYPLGQELAGLEAPLVRVMVDGARVDARGENVIARHPGGDPGAVVMLGAHLDSVEAGPGINDNGSGVATVLALAEASAACAPTRGLAFALWGAEELGLWGSFRHVEARSDEQLAALVAYLNFDMVASPNPVRYVYDGSLEGGAPPGSREIEDLFTAYFDEREQPWERTSLGGRSDYWAFQEAGVPVGGLFTGAGGEKSEAQAETFGGVAGAALDPCYHQPCDELANVDPVALVEMARAAAHVTEALAELVRPEEG